MVWDVLLVKQKTAYEMRISDGSSDVCSSDLLIDRAVQARNQGREADAQVRFTGDAREQLAAWADGDARRLISAVEVVAESAQAAGRDEIDADWLETSLSQNLRRFDKGGDAFYDQISALHKAVRGRSEEHTSELQSLMRISYAVFCLKKKTHQNPD